MKVINWEQVHIIVVKVHAPSEEKSEQLNNRF